MLILLHCTQASLTLFCWTHRLIQRLLGTTYKSCPYLLSLETLALSFYGLEVVLEKA